jgi:hypothetical protein
MRISFDSTNQNIVALYVVTVDASAKLTILQEPPVVTSMYSVCTEYSLLVHQDPFIAIPLPPVASSPSSPSSSFTFHTLLLLLSVRHSRYTPYKGSFARLFTIITV